MRIRTLIVAMITAAGLGTVVPAAGAASATQPSPSPDARFAAQADSLGITHAQAQRLQGKVDREVRRTHGAQVELNEVHWDGGNTVFVLPGETRARHLDAFTDATSRGSTHYRCPYLNFCYYTKHGYHGTMHELLHCRYYGTPYPIMSYVNNQTTGKRARFYDSDGDFWAWSKAAYWARPYFYDGGKVWSIKPC